MQGALSWWCRSSRGHARDAQCAHELRRARASGASSSDEPIGPCALFGTVPARCLVWCDDDVSGSVPVLNSRCVSPPGCRLPVLDAFRARTRCAMHASDASFANNTRSAPMRFVARAAARIEGRSTSIFGAPALQRSPPSVPGFVSAFLRPDSRIPVVYTGRAPCLCRASPGAMATILPHRAPPAPTPCHRFSPQFSVSIPPPPITVSAVPKVHENGRSGSAGDLLASSSISL